jgi:hypothetical protein
MDRELSKQAKSTGGEAEVQARLKLGVQPTADVPRTVAVWRIEGAEDATCFCLCLSPEDQIDGGLHAPMRGLEKEMDG